MLSSQEIAFFITLAQSKSLAAAARKLNVTPPSVSQRLQALEQKLNVKLVERGTRAISLTSEGELIFEEGRQVLQQIELLEEKVQQNKLALSGKLRIIAPVGYGTERIAPIAAQFQKEHPDLTIDLHLSDAPSWSQIDPPDIIIFIGQLKDSSLKRILLSKNKRFLVASPTYLATADVVRTPQDLLQHQCIALNENDDDLTMWKFTHNATGEDVSVRITPSLTSNIGPVVKHWTLEGYGIIQRSEWDIVEDLKTGRLVKLLPDYKLPNADIVALVSSTQEKRPAKVNRFIDRLKRSLSQRNDAH